MSVSIPQHPIPGSSEGQQVALCRPTPNTTRIMHNGSSCGAREAMRGSSARTAVSPRWSRSWMPLILTQNEATESGHAYADVLGQSYEYPPRYRNQIQTGEQFVYYRGSAYERRRPATAGLPRCRLIGAITPAAATGRLTCEIEDFLPFPEPLPFKDGNAYREPGPPRTRRGRPACTSELACGWSITPRSRRSKLRAGVTRSRRLPQHRPVS